MASVDGDAIRRFTKKKGWGRRELSEASGIYYQSFSKIWHKDSDPRLSTLARIAKALNVSVRSLIKDA